MTVQSRASWGAVRLVAAPARAVRDVLELAGAVAGMFAELADALERAKAEFAADVGEAIAEEEQLRADRAGAVR